MRCRRRDLIGVGLIALAVGAGMAYSIWHSSRPKPIDPPQVKLDDVDPQVAQSITRARFDVIDSRGRSAAAWGRFGMVLFAHDFNTEALTCFAEAERLDAADVRWPYYQGVLLAAERPTEALEPLRHAFHSSPARLRLAETLFALDRLDEAEAEFRKVVDPEAQPRVLLGVGLIAWRRGDLKAAVPLLERAGQDPHARRAARAALAEAQQRLGYQATAERLQAEVARLPKDPPWPDHLLEQVLDLQIGTRARLNQVNNLLLAGRVTEGLERAQQIVRDYPNSDMAHLALGRALIQAREYVAAEKQLAEAVRRWPNSIEAHLMRGGALSALGNYGDAAKCFERAIELSPSHALAHYNLATCLKRTGDRPAARRELAEAIRCRPDFVPAHVDLAELDLDAGDPAAAVNHLRDALRLSPDDERAKKLLDDSEAKTKKR